MRKSVLVLLLALLSLASPALAGPFFHEVWCPSVDTTWMTRVKRTAAVAQGLQPAPDCHPEQRVVYLGTIWSTGPLPSSAPAERRVHVDTYTKKDGTHVGEHERSYPTRRD
jgi:hypothetical protein